MLSGIILPLNNDSFRPNGKVFLAKGGGGVGRVV